MYIGPVLFPSKMKKSIYGIVLYQNFSISPCITLKENSANGSHVGHIWIALAAVGQWINVTIGACDPLSTLLHNYIRTALKTNLCNVVAVICLKLALSC